MGSDCCPCCSWRCWALCCVPLSIVEVIFMSYVGFLCATHSPLVELPNTHSKTQTAKASFISVGVAAAFFVSSVAYLVTMRTLAQKQEPPSKQCDVTVQLARADLMSQDVPLGGLLRSSTSSSNSEKSYGLAPNATDFKVTSDLSTGKSTPPGAVSHTSTSFNSENSYGRPADSKAIFSEMSTGDCSPEYTDVPSVHTDALSVHKYS